MNPSTFPTHAQDVVTMAGRELQRECHAASYHGGWWTHKEEGIELDLIRIIHAPVTPIEKLLSKALVSQKIALQHSELSESLEGFRKGKMDEHLPHRLSIEVELADAVIRIFDLAGALRLDLGAAIAEKMAYNATREDHRPESRAAAGGKAF